ncbi:hypothetical protein CFIMG_003631RA [Ceratocystis fimbriata CBS 114723]|uniref:MARVEL domain-containing protein n=1 Tax=Ceratocystis fimbriata CBS 114723 TaxID=1035309 RepID=A0A2C5XB29_9PEZI|nr:hypothetical protein CFIMG_003631RA [Ceratocystis fimbriata CBS 114723]
MIEVTRFKLFMCGLTLCLIIELGLAWGLIGILGPGANTPNFMLFSTIWTIVLLLYIYLSQKYLPQVFNRRVAFYALALTVIFWFSGSTALAAWVGIPDTTNNMERVAQGATAFGYFIWGMLCIMLWLDWNALLKKRINTAAFSSKETSLGTAISSLDYTYRQPSYSEVASSAA